MRVSWRISPRRRSSFSCCFCGDWWTRSHQSGAVTAPPCTAQEIVTSRKDRGAWWEAMIEKPSLNMFQFTVTGIALHRQIAFPQPESRCVRPLHKRLWKRTSQACASGNFYWFELRSLFPLMFEMRCRKTAQTSQAGVCVCLLCCLVRAQVCWQGSCTWWY